MRSSFGGGPGRGPREAMSMEEARLRPVAVRRWSSPRASGAGHARLRRRRHASAAAPAVSAAPGSGAGIAAAPRDGPAPAPVGPAGPVRRLLRRRPAGLLPAENLTVTMVPGGATSSRSGRVAADGPEFTIRWVPKVLQARRGRLGSRRHRPGLPALRDAVGDVEGGRDRRPVQASPERRSGSGTSATNSRSRPAPGLRPHAGSREQRRPHEAVPEGHPGLRHEGFPGP